MPKLELKKPPLRAGSSRSRLPVNWMKTSSSDIRSSLIDVTAAVELNDLIIRMESFVSVNDIRDDLLGGFVLQLLGLRDGVFGAGDFALVAIEDRQIHVEEERAAVDAGGVRVIEGDIEVALAVGLGERLLTLRGGDAEMSGLKIGPAAQGERFEIVQAGVHRLVVEFPFYIEAIGDGFKTDRLAQGGEGLRLGEPGGENVTLKLQELKFDFEQVTLAHASGVETGFADFDGVNVETDRATISQDDLEKVLNLLQFRPIQFCLFLKALVGAEQMERMMVEAIAVAKRQSE